MLALRDHDPLRIADYRLLGRLGEGGMGVVYLARSPRGRMAAVKSIKAELAEVPDFRRRFANEVAMARRVGGEWTAAVLDADPDAERPWVATAYVPGPTLAEVVAQHGPLPEQSLRSLAFGLCRALGDIHAAGLVHRDLKPSNIMITIDGPRVIDFGIVRALDAATHGGMTSTGMVVGTPGFMAPEQVRGERLTEAADVFSLGAVLVFAACGRMPFEASEGQVHALMYRVVHEEPDLTGVPEPLLGLVRDCLAKDPAARPTLPELRAREETLHQRLGPWLPAEILARLGQDAAQLLEHEDPGTRVDIVARSGMPRPDAADSEAPTVPAGLRSEGVAARGGRTHEQPQRLLADERNEEPHGVRSAKHYAVAVYAALGLFALVSAGIVSHMTYLLNESRYYYFTHDEDEVMALWAISQLAAGIGLVGCWLLWFAKVRDIAESFAPGRLRYEPSMAIRAWFIPVRNLYLPKQIADDIWHASSTPGQAGMASAGPLRTWWVFWLITFVTWPLYWLSFGVDFFRGGDDGTADLKEFGWIPLLFRLFVIPTAVVTARYVHRLTAMQSVRLNA
ncbi:protein kinase domain-containing protein [Streptomyces fungicidicus]|uniref:protein kinase domain-containing protein n=1 Tax=Streptomyces fungicidicus TaxID=68203 RepID=UPI0036693636